MAAPGVLYISAKRAEEAGARAVAKRTAYAFTVRPTMRRNPDDHSIERGYVVILHQR